MTNRKKSTLRRDALLAGIVRARLARRIEDENWSLEEARKRALYLTGKRKGQPVSKGGFWKFMKKEKFVPSRATVLACAAPAGMDEEELKATAELRASRGSSMRAIPHTLISASPDGVLLRWCGVGITVTREELLRRATNNASPLRSCFFIRPAPSLFRNVKREPTREKSEHPLAHIPFTYLPMDLAARACEGVRASEPDFRLLFLRGWTMELNGGTFALLERRTAAQPTVRSEFARKREHSEPAAERYLKSVLARPIILERDSLAEVFVASLRARLLGPNPKAAPVQLVASIAPIVQALDSDLLAEEAVVAVDHPQLWALRAKQDSRTHVLFTDEALPRKALPRKLQSIRPRPYKIIVVNEKELGAEDLDVAARYFTVIGRKAKRYFEQREDDSIGYINGLLDDFGTPGFHYDGPTLAALIDKGLTLHIDKRREPRFVELTEAALLGVANGLH